MKPVVLGIDTSGSSCSVALVHDADVYARRAAVGNAHSKYVLAMLREVLADASSSLEECDAIAYAAGPGSFTGLRVACAVTQALAFGAGRPVIAVGTLNAIAHSVSSTLNASSTEILVAMDARMGEVYWALLNATDGRLTATMPAALASPAALGARIAERFAEHNGRPIAIGCGNAWSVHGDALHGLVERVIHRDNADAVDVAHLGRIACLDGKTIAAEDAVPLYVRDDVAQTTAQRERQRLEGSAVRAAASPSAAARGLRP